MRLRAASIRRSAGWKRGPVNLAFEDMQMVTKSENLDLKRGVRLPAEDAGIEQRPDQGVEQSQKHRGRS